jgi:hypothetical protein
MMRDFRLSTKHSFLALCFKYCSWAIKSNLLGALFLCVRVSSESEEGKTEDLKFPFLEETHFHGEGAMVTCKREEQPVLHSYLVRPIELVVMAFQDWK